MAGYHINNIEKGIVGELSKIYEEVDEVMDADKQQCKLMVLIELSDLIGAVESYLEKHHPSLTLNDLISMKNITKRVFKEGYR